MMLLALLILLVLALFLGGAFVHLLLIFAVIALIIFVVLALGGRL